MWRFALVYGGAAGLITIIVMTAGIASSDGQGVLGSQAVGYLIMLVAMSLIFVGIKRYRDTECGGVIKFLPAFGLGLGMAAVAGVAYVIVWEIYLATTDYAFYDQYAAAQLETKRAAGATQAELDALRQSMDMFQNPVVRAPITFLELFPIGFVIALVSAALLRNPKVFPAQGPVI